MSKEDQGNEGQIKEKLIQSKRKWAAEGRLLTGRNGLPADRLPPGQHVVTNWPVLDLGIQPDVKKADWSLTVDGLVAQPLKWSWDDFAAQPAFEDVSDIHCVTSWSRYDNHWAGVSAAYLLAMAQPAATARHVVFHSYDGYTTNVRLDHFAAEDVLLAHSWQGQPISREHGGPVRVIMPRYYFWKSAKWVQRIEFCAEDKPGFWEVRGYHNEGDPWTEDRYS
jgi:DMSO/TMAO reductase YedYZ molybdopterin-dependent catalytic subunit